MADVKKVIEIIDKIIADVDEQKLFLTELDNVIGDGDHGINLARGFDAVKTIEDTFESKDIGAICFVLIALCGCPAPRYVRSP